jgi:quinol---cytochrome c reductase iron-sulfur subunit
MNGGQAGERRTQRLVGAGLVVSTLASVGAIVVYWTDASVQAQGVTVGVALLGLAFALGAWAERAMPSGQDEEPRVTMPSRPEDREAFVRDLAEGEQVFSRRKGLIALLVIAAGGLVTAFAAPLRSLGPRPGDQFQRTAWRAGRRLVTDDGEPVALDALPVGGVLTVFPDGEMSPGDSQVILVRIEPDELHLDEDRQDWAPEGYVGYSKLCTHAGCPVGLFESETNQLLCPCHQSIFDAADGARVVFGPASRSLPQLPLDVDDEGFLIARSDFTEWVGPGFWTAP